MTGPMLRPLVGISCNRQDGDAAGYPRHVSSEKYIEAVIEAAGAMPVLLPALGDTADIDTLLHRLDGIVLTGGVSNVEPHHYDGPPSRDGTPHDPYRDGLTLRLIRAAIDARVPVLGICRGIQEMNVAFGGSLHQYLHEVPGRFDHRRERHKPLDEQLAPRHKINLTPGGQLAELLNATEVVVNSLHGQGIDRVGDGLTVEAVAEDGTVEALRLTDRGRFALGVQWHAEWQAVETPVHAAIFGAFGDAVGAFAATRSDHGRRIEVA